MEGEKAHAYKKMIWWSGYREKGSGIGGTEMLSIDWTCFV